MKSSESFNFNFDWKFFEGTPTLTQSKDAGFDIGNSPLMTKWTKATSFDYALPDYDDSNWQNVQLPHDFVIEKSVFSDKVPFQTGSLETGIGWYRKIFTLPKGSEHNRIFLQFNGIYRNSELWVNGDIIKRQLGGFMGFCAEITEAVNYSEESAVAVLADASEMEGWWYTGGGIYRDVFLHIVPKLCFVHDGIYIKTKNVDLTNNNCNFEVEFELDNLNNSTCEFMCNISFYDNQKLISHTTYENSIDTNEIKLFTTKIDIKNAVLWSVDTPHLYKAVVALHSKHGTHTKEIKFGPKHIEYNSQKGMLLNGKKIFIKGACGHDDFAGVGVALNRSIIEYKIDKLKEMGVNGYRCAHNPPDPVFLDVCDEKGILVMDENRWPAVSDISMKLFINMIRRDRNHASVFIWSFGNEEASLQGKDKGVRVLTKMKNIALKYDDTREYMLAINAHYLSAIQNHEKLGLKYIVNGVNYFMLRDFTSPQKLHEAFPEMCFFNTEIASAYNTRVYKMHTENREDKISCNSAITALWMDQSNRGNVTCYGDSHPKWGHNAEEALKAYEGHKHMCGMFLWTGLDYRGETSPYRFPNVVSSYGFIDYCGFFKPWANYLKAYWCNEKTINLMPLSWNLFEAEGTPIKVYALANCNEVELFLNGKSLGKQQKQPLDRGYWLVPYEKGELLAVAYHNGQEIARNSLKTSGKEHYLKLTTLKNELFADGSDCTVIAVSVFDESGIEVTDSEIEVNFETIGAVKIIGTGNGNHFSHEHDKAHTRKLYGGKAIVIVQSGFNDGIAHITATSKEALSDELPLKIKTFDTLKTL